MQACDPEVFQNGTVLYMIAGRATFIEALVSRCRGELRIEKLDWHYAGGRGLIKHIGPAEEAARIQTWIDATRPEWFPETGQGYPMNDQRGIAQPSE